ncbi:MAG: potassium channel family protein [Chloroflexota bacterium]
MNAIVIGGGKVGWYLVETLVGHGHVVSVIDDQPQACARIAEEFNVTVICGDGTSTKAMADAGADRADVVAAVTGQDEENLVACQLAKRVFGVARAIARVNNPKNERVFRDLGVDAAVSSTSIIAGLIEREAIASSLKTLFAFKKGDLEIVQVDIDNTATARGMSIRNIHVPEQCVLVSIIRGEHVIIPRGDTVLMSGDAVLALTPSENQEALSQALVGRR